MTIESKANSRASIPDQWEMLYQGLEKEETPTQGKLFGDTISDEPVAVNSLVEDKSPSHYQYKGKYIMTAVKSGLMIIDQHRAHVRILYEQYLQQVSARTATVQKVLFPETVQLSQSQRVVYEKVAPELQAIGFDLSDLGNGNFAINGIPAGLDGINPVNLILDMVDAAAEGTLSAKADIDASLAWLWQGLLPLRMVKCWAMTRWRISSTRYSCAAMLIPLLMARLCSAY